MTADSRSPRVASIEESLAMTREERRQDAHDRIIRDPENHPDPVIRRLFEESRKRALRKIVPEQGA